MPKNVPYCVIFVSKIHTKLGSAKDVYGKRFSEMVYSSTLGELFLRARARKERERGRVERGRKSN